MAPKKYLLYSRERSKFVSPSRRLVIGSYDDRDPEYVQPGTRTRTNVAITTRGTPMKVASYVVTTSQFDEKRTLIGKPFGFASGFEGASDCKEVFGSEEASSSHGPNVLAVPVHSVSSYDADSVDSTQASLTNVPTPVGDQPNQWCVEVQYQVYRYTKIINDQGVMTRTLTVERRVLTKSLNYP